MISFILARLYKLFGWKVDGKIPDLRKYVVIVAPHTSNWDFFVGWGFRNVVGFRPNFLAKRELFNIPLVGLFFKSIGGVPVDRKNSKKSMQLVDQVVDLFKSRDEFIMTITPEGTRKYSPKWKTGFYRIAIKAEVPIVKIAFDYGTKTVFVDKPYNPPKDADMDTEIEKMKDYFKQFTGKNPEDGVK